MKTKIQYNKGDKIGELIFIADVESIKVRKALFLCKCGKEFIANISNAKRRICKSCGCYNAECFDKNRKGERHNLHKHRLYGIWQNIKNRCKNTSLDYYGANGITICTEWRDKFSVFYSWAINNGYKDNLSIDRINGKENYTPENCRWATPKEQSSNRKNNIIIKYNGQNICLKKYCELNGINNKIYNRIRNRITVRGWDIDRAINEPKRYETNKNQLS